MGFYNTVMAEDEAITRAAGLLSTLLHCRRQAKELQACQRLATRDSNTSCAREEAAFVTCSNEHLQLVIGHMIKIADVHCTAHIQAVQRCRMLSPGSDCEAEDLAVLRCAALKVLESASAAPHSAA